MEQKNTNKIPEEKDLYNSSPHTLKKIITAPGGYEKRALILLIAFLLIGVPLSIWQINNQLKDPFERKVVSTSDNINSSISINEEQPVIQNLREIDTDQDGLSDYDELYRHETSPYIADSDSDGISDKLEIDQDTDPNCPDGTTCGRQDVATLVDVNEELAGLENLTIEQLRQIMIDAGAPVDEVNKIPDEDLLAVYQQILAEEEITENKEINLETIDYDTLLDANPTEIRQILIEAGVSEEDLNQIDDETLKYIYLESLGQNIEETYE